MGVSVAFIRKKTINGREYHYLVESYRSNGKVKQKTLAYLGRHPSVQAKVEWLGRRLRTWQSQAEENRAKLEKLGDKPLAGRMYYIRKYAREGLERRIKEISEIEQELASLKSVVPKVVSHCSQD